MSLLPCPFCGTIPDTDDGETGGTVECCNRHCSVQPSIFRDHEPSYDGLSLAVQEWNTRGGNDAIAQALAEIDRAVSKFPTWPTDALHALAVLGEEYGELTKAVLQGVYEPHKNKPGDVRKEAIQTAAMALRFLASVGVYSTDPCPQHSQAPNREVSGPAAKESA